MRKKHKIKVCLLAYLRPTHIYAFTDLITFFEPLVISDALLHLESWLRSTRWWWWWCFSSRKEDTAFTYDAYLHRLRMKLRQHHWKVNVKLYFSNISDFIITAQWYAQLQHGQFWSYIQEPITGKPFPTISSNRLLDFYLQKTFHSSSRNDEWHLPVNISPY